MNFNPKNRLIYFFYNIIRKYNPKKYWKRRYKIVSKNKIPMILKLYYLYYVKKTDFRHNASMGTDLNKGAFFATPPNLPHGLNGIIIHHKARIGKNVTIFQQVTIGEKQGRSAIIGDDVVIGAGVKIIGDVTIGTNVKIGANAVVTKSFPNDVIIAGVPAKIIGSNL